MQVERLYRPLKKVAITGGIASGKSTVARIFKDLGAYVTSADDIVHQLLTPVTALGKDIISFLGPEVVVDGLFSHERIAERVFCDPSLLEKLEQRVHPEVQREIESQYQKVSQKSYPLFVAEVPLLFESGMQRIFDVTILVVSDEKTCRLRFPYGEEEYDRRSARLIPIREKCLLADIVIENNGNLEKLKQFVETNFNSLKGSL